MAYQVTERLYVDKAGKTYTEAELTERSEVSLLMSAGGELTDEEAKKYGLTGKAAKAAPVAAADDDIEVDEPDTEAKAVSAPPANKARTASPERK